MSRGYDSGQCQQDGFSGQIFTCASWLNKKQVSPSSFNRGFLGCGTQDLCSVHCTALWVLFWTRFWEESKLFSNRMFSLSPFQRLPWNGRQGLCCLSSCSLSPSHNPAPSSSTPPPSTPPLPTMSLSSSTSMQTGMWCAFPSCNMALEWQCTFHSCRLEPDFLSLL